MRAPIQEPIATAGQSQIAARFKRLGWGVAPNPYHDLGTDLWLMVRDDRRFDLGLLVGAQGKTSETDGHGTKYFSNPHMNAAGEVDG